MLRSLGKGEIFKWLFFPPVQLSTGTDTGNNGFLGVRLAHYDGWSNYYNDEPGPGLGSTEEASEAKIKTSWQLVV